MLDRVNSLETFPTGPELVAALGEIDVAMLDSQERVDVWRAEQRLVAHYQARSYLSMLSVEQQFRDEGDDPNQAFAGTSAEFQICGALTRRGADSELGFSEAIWWRLPSVGRALWSGTIDARRARTLAHGTEHLPEPDARAIADELVGLAPELTTSQLAGRIRRRCIETNPDEAKARYEQSVEERKVMSRLTPEGTANLHIIDADPHQVAAASRNIDWLAKQLKRAGDKRPTNQIRADVALDLLRGRTAKGKPGGGVHIHTDLETLAHLKDHPGDLAGYGPVIADMARQTTEQQHNAPWEFTVTDPRTGDVIATGTTRRRPTVDQARFARAQHPSCIFPGCQMPAQDCDLDHRIAWNDSHRTDAKDLAPGCRYHHVVKQDLPGHTESWAADGSNSPPG